MTLMYFNDDNPLGLIKSCHSVGKINFPSSEEECSASVARVMAVFSFQIVYSHNCLYPCQECVGLMRKLSRCLLSPLITLAQYSQYSSITLYGNTSHHLYLRDLY